MTMTVLLQWLSCVYLTIRQHLCKHARGKGGEHHHQSYKYINTNTQKQIHKYKYTNTNTHIQIHKYKNTLIKYTNTSTQL